MKKQKRNVGDSRDLCHGLCHSKVIYRHLTYLPTYIQISVLRKSLDHSPRPQFLLRTSTSLREHRSPRVAPVDTRKRKVDLLPPLYQVDFLELWVRHSKPDEKLVHDS